MRHFTHFGCEVLIGASRKSMIDKIIPTPVEARLPGDNPVATDEEYDRLYHEVLAYEEAHPERVREDSPTQRVGGVVREEFTKARHIKRMWSMEDVFSKEEVAEWLERVEKSVGLSAKR